MFVCIRKSAVKLNPDFMLHSFLDLFPQWSKLIVGMDVAYSVSHCFLLPYAFLNWGIYLYVSLCITFLNRGRMSTWLEILQVTGKNQFRQSTKLVQDLRLKLDFHQESKFRLFLSAIHVMAIVKLL